MTMRKGEIKIRIPAKNQANGLRNSRGETLAESILSLLLLSLAVLMVSTMMASVMRMNRETHETRVSFTEALAKIDAGELPQNAQSIEAAFSLTLTLEDKSLGVKEQAESAFLPVCFDIAEGLVADIRPGGQ